MDQLQGQASIYRDPNGRRHGSPGLCGRSNRLIEFASSNVTLESSPMGAMDMQHDDKGKRVFGYPPGLEAVLLLTLCLAVSGIATVAAVTAIDGGWNGSEGKQLITLAAIFAAGVVASVAGFAFSALAAALLSHLYPNPVEMVAILLVSSIAVQSYCLAKLWMHICWKSVLPYLLGGLAVLPIAIHLLASARSDVYGTVLGLFLLAYALLALFVPANARLHAPRGSAFVVGALGGLTGGLAAFPGAFVTIWCGLQGLAKEQQRALCQPFILVMQVSALVLLYNMAGMTEHSPGPLWIYVPVALLSAYTGMKLFAKLSDRQFRSVVVVMLAVSGLLLIARAV